MANFDKQVVDKIYQMYIDNKFGYNETCMQCKNKFDFENGPIPIFHVGEKYRSNEKRLAFIGLVAYGWNGTMPDQDKIWSEIFDYNQDRIDKTQLDIENRIRELYFLENENVRYLSFINEACTEIFGGIQNGFDNIALTNFVHCNSGEVKHSFPQSVINFCTRYQDGGSAGYIHKELEILDPTHIVVLTTSSQYDKIYDDLAPSPKYLRIIHPSAPGRVKNDFIDEITNFYNE